MMPSMAARDMHQNLLDSSAPAKHQAKRDAERRVPSLKNIIGCTVIYIIPEAPKIKNLR